MKNLVIVESPAKARTIERYLGKDYKVMSSVGHIRDLPKSKMGINVQGGMVPEYVTIKGKSGIISSLKKAVPDGGTVYLAQDLDREGEAIAWHVGQVLGLFDESGNPKKVRGKIVKYKRIVFNEITKDAIKRAVVNPREVDMNLVDAQQARRILDRLVGYTLSPLLWKKVRYGLSAGRVQSVAVRLIVDRERERDRFKPQEYWSVIADLYKDSVSDLRQYELVKLKGEKLEIGTEEDVSKIRTYLESGQNWEVVNVSAKNISKKPSAPFTTSTLQQAAYNYLKFTSKRTMGVAQRLYQGVDAGERGILALITYMRTDSTNLSTQAVSNIREFISDEYGENTLFECERVYKRKSKSAQEAHEAIRPTDIGITPDVAANFLDSDMLKLYSLIWKRVVATQMQNAQYSRETVEVSCGDYLFRSSEQVLISPGYLSLYGKKSERSDKKSLVVGDGLKLENLITDQHYTQPPARYNEASLVKALELHGVGRPSTYASIISTILARGYVIKDSGAFKPEDVGCVVTDLLIKHFPQIVDLDFTSEMEDSLDDVANGKKDWVPVLENFYSPFEKQVKQKEESIDKEDIVVLGESDEKCDKCGADMVVKLGKYGRFISCKKFPKCKGIKSIELDTPEEFWEKYEKAASCPECKSDMSLKVGKYGKFWACSKYPDCKGVASLLLKENCPECGGNLVERKGRWGKDFTGCSGYPNCKYIKKKNKDKEEKKE